MAAAMAVVISVPAVLSLPVYAAPSVKSASWGVSNLSAAEQNMYGHLVRELERIIENGGSTEITFSGVQFDSDDNAVNVAKVQDIWGDLYTCVSRNHPELLFFEEINADDLTAENMSIDISTSSFSVKIGVDKKYRGDGEYSLSSSAYAIYSSALNTAESVISANSSKGTYDTIKAYADWIADQVSYDHTAAAQVTSAISDSSPWNLISVFDQDSSTNVVCEGYAKALQYLMDNTSRFTNAGITSKIVTSTVAVNSSSSGTESDDDRDDETGHMWNVVTINGSNYLVDVTWYDTDSSVPYRTKYLLGGEDAAKSDTTGLHDYDIDTTGFYTADELELSESAYDSSSVDPLNPGSSETGGSSAGNDAVTGGAITTGPATGSDTDNTTSGNTSSGTAGNTGNTSSGNTTTGSNTGNTSSGTSGNTGSSTNTGTSGNTGSSSNSGSSTTGSNTGNTSSGSTSTGSTTGNTSSGSTSSNSSTSSNTQTIVDTTPVQYNSTGALIGGDKSISTTITYTAPQTGDTSYPWADTVSTTTTTQIVAVESKTSQITTLTAGSKKLTLKFKKVTVNGKTVKYQVALKQSTAKTWKKSYVSSTKKTFNGLKKGKTYWVSVRPYITVDGTRYFGKWSKTLTKKVK